MNTDTTPNVGRQIHELQDSELDAVTGGLVVISNIGILLSLLIPAVQANKAARK